MKPINNVDLINIPQKKRKLYRVFIFVFLVVTLSNLACSSLNKVARFVSYLRGDSYTPYYQEPNNGQNGQVWHEFATAITNTTYTKNELTTKLASMVVDIPTLEKDGYMAIRIPHAPPTYTVSSVFSPTVTFIYRTVPTGTKITVPITMTRRDEYLPAVNAAFPINDNQSHWEVLWLPNGATFPIPDGSFELKPEDLPFQINYGIDFGIGSNYASCAGCELDYQLYNGFNFINIFSTRLLLSGVPKPSTIFDRCGQSTLAMAIKATEPYTHEHCLGNIDNVTKTYTVTFSSSENRPYTIYTQTITSGVNGPGPIPFTGNQLTVKAGNEFDGVRIMAVYTGTITSTNTTRETFIITATSVISPEVKTVARSMSYGPAYQLNEDGSSGSSQSVYLPIVVKN